jgi:hypothetical protein
LEIAAYSRRTSFLAYTFTLPEVTEAWVRKLIKMPRGVIIAQFELGARELAAVQRIVELKLEPDRFLVLLRRRVILQREAGDGRIQTAEEGTEG